MNGCQVSSPPDCHGGLSVKIINTAINKRSFHYDEIFKMPMNSIRNHFTPQFRKGEK